MSERGLDGYVITSGDAHGSEYAADYWRTREWVSGFTGSAGLLVVLPEEAGLWTDGRYFIQAERELHKSGIALFKNGEPDVQKYQAYLAEKLPKNGKLGFDGRTIMSAEFSKIKDALREKEISYETDDIVDLIWKKRPPLPKEAVFEHKFAGKFVSEKLADVRAKMKEKKITAYLVTALDSVAWLLNLRGNDIQGTPVFYAFALIMEEEAHLFIDSKKLEGLRMMKSFALAPSIAKVLNDVLPGFTIQKYEDLPGFLVNLKTEKLYFNSNNTNVLLEKSYKKAFAVPKPKKRLFRVKKTSKVFIGSKIRNTLNPIDDIIPMLKAVKTDYELGNIKNAFIKEGVVMVRTLRRLDEAQKTAITEGSVVSILKNFRESAPDYLCDSFSAVVAYGENAAQAHYSPGEIGTPLREEGFLLIDTGGQYLDGTTDTTRTIALGALTDEMKHDFTLVLKGHIALARAVFLSGTTGTGLDILARSPILQGGYNYRHGTGHGIGYCLSVHEGPHNISHHQNTVSLVPGMLITNEPAIYKEDQYGIRIESVLAVKENNSAEGNFLCFETITHCPIDTHAVNLEMLTPDERDWLNNYHKTTFETLSPLLTPPEREWLKNATEPI
jgi:Xaa-Pro aminopeptidase